MKDENKPQFTHLSLVTKKWTESILSIINKENKPVWCLDFDVWTCLQVLGLDAFVLKNDLRCCLHFHPIKILHWNLEYEKHSLCDYKLWFFLLKLQFWQITKHQKQIKPAGFIWCKVWEYFLTSTHTPTYPLPCCTSF